MAHQIDISGTRLALVRGDITQQDTEAIVNAANSGLMGGGGVDGAIHRAGGPEILAECKAIVAETGRCPTGEAVITTGGKLAARYVVHAVGPVWHGGGRNEAALLANAYENSLRLAADRGARTIAFPSISTGAYGYPVEQAAAVALSAVIGAAKSADVVGEHVFDEIRFVLFSESDLEAYADALSRLD